MHHDLYYVPVVSCSYLVRLVLSLFAHTVIARSACLSIVRPCRRYQHRFIPRECRAWGVAAELELGFAAGSKRSICRTHDFHYRLDPFRSTRVPHGLQGLGGCTRDSLAHSGYDARDIGTNTKHGAINLHLPAGSPSPKLRGRKTGSSLARSKQEISVILRASQKNKTRKDLSRRKKIVLSSESSWRLRPGFVPLDVESRCCPSASSSSTSTDTDTRVTGSIGTELRMLC